MQVLNEPARGCHALPIHRQRTLSWTRIHPASFQPLTGRADSWAHATSAQGSPLSRANGRVTGSTATLGMPVFRPKGQG
eukprot:357808-Chlamydomonas_euryale.AAC.8